jgi:arsenate reductase
LDRRISLFLSLPLSTLDDMALRKELNNIGRQSLASAPER